MPVLSEQQMRRVDKNTKRPVSYDEAKNSAQRFHDSMNLGRGTPVDQVPQMVRDFSDTHPVRVFNVGPWKQTILQGTLGTFRIPACPEDKSYVEMVTYDNQKGKWVPSLGALTFEPLRGEGQMPIRQHESLEIAQAILGIGAFQNPANRLTKFGCFISACGPDEEPYPKELEDARKQLKEYLTSMIIDVRKAYSDGKVGEVRGADHYLAARILKLNPANEPWMKDMIVDTNEVCPGCGVSYRKGIAVCPTASCRTILDEEKFNKLKRAS